MANKTQDNSKTEVVKRQLTGTVYGAAEDKTIHVSVRTKKMDTKYRKQYWSTKKYAVHDEKNTAHVGDVVLFQESRPYSKTKTWSLVKVLENAL
ncbi:30S ribosomal protein S17 [Patescibacteria group bacterium]|nr:30S ribosomal protein S17 [Patescibacteria group bacterium]MBU1721582.1 30S ribosomal protein S17 [Patescibacteria group bacterium]MBU1901808.1 30S ribosomal protein S17 [Patescibacteria group bacterium]